MSHTIFAFLNSPASPVPQRSWVAYSIRTGATLIFQSQQVPQHQTVHERSKFVTQSWRAWLYGAKQD